MRIIFVQFTFAVCLLLTGCVHRLNYDSVKLHQKESSVSNAVTADNIFASDLRTVSDQFRENTPIRNTAEVPSYIADQSSDAAIALGSASLNAPIEVAKPTVRDIPAIGVNKATDIVHDGAVNVSRQAGEIVQPTLNAVHRGITKLIVTPFMSVDDKIRSKARSYSVGSYQGPMSLSDQRHIENWE